MECFVDTAAAESGGGESGSHEPRGLAPGAAAQNLRAIAATKGTAVRDAPDSAVAVLIEPELRELAHRSEPLHLRLHIHTPSLAQW